MKTTKTCYKTYWLVVILTLLFFKTQAQQAPQYAQYLYNIQTINPAFVGEKSDFNVALLTRRQWVSVEGAPKTTTFSTNGRLRGGLGLGATVIHEEIGLANITDLDIDLSYTTVLSNFGRLSVGLKGGLGFFNNNLSNGITVDGESYESISDQYADIGFGILYNTRSFFVAFSAPNLIKAPTFTLRDDVSASENIRGENYFITTGGRFNISKFHDIVFRPSTLIKYTPTLPVSIDINAHFIYNKTLEAGLSYRFKNALSAVAGIIINEKFRIGYAYENQFPAIGNNLSTHEIILRLDLMLNRQKRWVFEDCCLF